jgi:digeranylgeranylglycerophospholipid reductase
MVIGTAAKQVDPIHGGGIALAMESGIMAADTILKAFEKKDFSKNTLMPYQNSWNSGPGKKCAKRLLLRKVLEKVTDDDLNYIFNTITPKDLDDTMTGKFAGPVAKVLAGRPSLLKILGALIS